MDQCHPIPTYHWRPQTITAHWIHASRHIIVNTDGEEMDRKILCRKGSLTHLLQFSNASHISMKKSLPQIGCWTFTCWNKLLFFTFTEVLASQKLSTEAIRIEQRMWLDCCSCELWLLATDNSVMALSFYDARLVKWWNFLDLKLNTGKQLFGSLSMTHECEARTRLIHSLANQGQGLSTFNFICSSYTWALDCSAQIITFSS